MLVRKDWGLREGAEKDLEELRLMTATLIRRFIRDTG
jgi:hypothetical protein